MSEKMEVKAYDGKWYPCLYVSPPDDAGDIAVVYNDVGEYITTHVFPEDKNSLRPLSPEKPETDDWRAKNAKRSPFTPEQEARIFEILEQNQLLEPK